VILTDDEVYRDTHAIPAPGWALAPRMHCCADRRASRSAASYCRHLRSSGRIFRWTCRSVVAVAILVMAALPCADAFSVAPVGLQVGARARARRAGGEPARWTRAGV